MEKNKMIPLRKAVIAAGIFMCIFMFGAATGCFIIFPKTGGAIFISVIIPAIFCIIAVFMLWLLNRECARIWYDEETKTVERKGLFRGYKKSLRIEDIKRVVIVRDRVEEWILLVDDEKGRVENFMISTPFINFKFNKNNVEFVKQFWDKPIEKLPIFK